MQVNLTRRPTRFAVCLAFFGVVSAANSSIHAQTNAAPVVRSTQEDAILSRAETALDYAARRAGVTLVLEGEPFKRTLTPREVQTIDPTAPPAQLLEQIASAYDYSAEPQKRDSVVVFKKCYTDPNDLPFVTLAEARASLRDMARIFAKFSPPGNDPDIMVGTSLLKFVGTLSPEQIAAMANPTQGLSIGQLTPVQRDLLWRVPAYVYVQTSEDLMRRFEKQVELASDPTATIGTEVERAKTNEYKPMFGFAAPMPGKTPPHYFRALNGANLSPPSLGGTRTIFSITGYSNADDHTVPSPASQTAAKEKREAKILAVTLREALRQNASRALDDALRVVVAEEIADKPVVVFNSIAAAPQAILRGLASVYDLQLTTKADGFQYVSRPRIPDTKTAADIPGALQKLLPGPFSRALHWQDRKGISEQMRAIEVRLYDAHTALWKASQNPFGRDGNAPSPSTPSPSAAADEAKSQIAALEKEQTQLRTRLQNLSSNPYNLRWAAVRSLRTKVEPHLKSETQPMIPIPSLNAEEQAALADFFLTDLWLAISGKIENPAPGYIAHFDDGFVFSGSGMAARTPGVPVAAGAATPSKPAPGSEVRFGYRNSDGKLVDGGLSYKTFF